MIESVGQWLKRCYPNYDGAVTVDVEAKKTEEKIGEDNPQLKIGKNPYTYKRYGYGLSNFVAQKFTANVGAISHGFSARLTNCGMAAIKTVFDVLGFEFLGVGTTGQCIASNVLYSETEKLLRKRLPDVFFANPATLLEAISNKCPRFVFVEPVGNGWGMPIYDLREIFRQIWQKETVLIVDNTLLSCANLNPFEILRQFKCELGVPNFKLIYIESLSKHYRVGDDDLITAGIIVAPDRMIDEIDAMIAQIGAYLQFPCLKELPIDLFAVCREVIGRLNERGRSMAQSLQKLGVSVSYPNLPGGGGVIYFVVKEDVDGVVTRMQKQFGPRKGSFGHPHTTWVPFGKLITGNPPGLIRLAVGFKDDIVGIREKLQKVLS